MKKIKKNELLKVKNLAENSADIYIYGDIVSASYLAWGEDVYPELIKEYTSKLEGKKLNIYINSGGGSVFAGMAIYNMLKRLKTEKTCYIDGVAASIASIIALAADKIIMPSNAYLMIHNPWVSVSGNAKELRDYADSLDKFSLGLQNVYSDNSNLTEEKIQDLMDKETWLTGVEASTIFNNIVLTEETDAVASISDLNYSKTPENIQIKNENDEIEALEMELDIL